MKKLIGLVSIKGKTVEQVHEELLKVLSEQDKNKKNKRKTKRRLNTA